jgi:hypothetical protein
MLKGRERILSCMSKPKQFEHELRSLAQLVNECCLQAAREECTEPLSRAVLAIAREAPALRGTSSLRYFGRQLGAALAEENSLLPNLVCPRVYLNRQTEGVLPFRSLIGILPKGPFPRLLEQEGLNAEQEFTLDTHLIYVRKSRLPNEEWLFLADPYELKR